MKPQSTPYSASSILLSDNGSIAMHRLRGTTQDCIFFDDHSHWAVPEEPLTVKVQVGLRARNDLRQSRQVYDFLVPGSCLLLRQDPGVNERMKVETIDREPGSLEVTLVCTCTLREVDRLKKAMQDKEPLKLRIVTPKKVVSPV